MRPALTPIKALLLTILASVASPALCQEIPPANPDPKDLPALDRLKLTELLVNRQTQDYSVTLDINGAPYASYGSGSGWKVDAAPFKEGTNHVVVSFTPAAAGNPKGRSGALTLVLADSPKPQPNHSLILYAFSAADNAYCVTDLTFQFMSGQAVKLQLKEDHWIDAAHKKHIYELVSRDGSVWGPYDQHERSWWSNGQACDETLYKLSQQVGSLALFESKDYKPDGTLAAEVTNGNGVRRTYYDAGVIEMEALYHDGVLSGPYKKYDVHGTVRIAGSFKDSQQDGIWTHFDEHGQKTAQCTYASGQPLNGAAPIDPDSITAPAKP